MIKNCFENQKSLSSLAWLQKEMPRSARYRYGVAIAIVLAATAVRMAFLQLLSARAPFVTFYPAVLLAALYGGLGSGLLAAALSAALVDYFWMEPRGAFAISDPADWLALAFFFLSSALVCWVTVALRRARLRAAAAEEQAKFAAERQRAAEALRTGQEKLTLALRSARMGAWRLDLHEQKRFYDDQVCRCLGIDPAHFRGTSEEFYAAVHPDDRAKLKACLEQTIATGAPYEVEYRAVWPDKSVHYIAARGQLAQDAGGREQWIDGVVWDITERKRNDEHLARQRAVLHGVNDILASALSTDTEADFGQNCLGVIEALTGSKISFVGEIGPDGLLHDLASHHRPPPGSFQINGIYGQVLKEGKSLIANDPAFPPRPIGLPEGHPPVTSFLGVPLLRAGKVAGMLAVGNREGGYRLEEQQTLEALAPVIVEALDRKRAERALQQERDRLMALINSIRDEIWFASTDGRFTLVNPAASREFNLEANETTDVRKLSGDIEVLRPDGTPRPVEEAPPLRALRGEVITSQEELVRTPSTGDLRHRQVSAAPVLGRDGNIVGSVSVVRDITVLKRAEEAVRASEERLRALVGATSDVVCRMSPDWREMWDLKGQDFIPDTEAPSRTWIEKYIHPKDQPRFLAAIQEAIRTKSTFQLEHQVLRVDGSLGWVFSRAIPLLDARGVIVEWVGAASDITERKQAETALREAKTIAEEANRQKDHFLAVLGHELRNPLAPIRNAVAILKRSGPPDPILQRSRDLIDRQVTHMTRLIDDLLDISRIARGKITLQKDEFDPVEVVQVAVEDHRPLLEANGVNLSFSAPAQPLRAFGDPARISQIVGNLVMNANKFTDRGGKVTVDLRTEGKHQAILTVRDTGIGMDAKTIETLFTPFAQADRSIARTRGGLGLGLALVKGLVELHGGSAKAFSAGLGHGSEFVVVLPILVQQEVQPAAPPSGPAQAGRPLRVLIIEDNKDAAETLEMLLKFNNHDVAVAYSGREGLEKAKPFKPEAVLCDIGLPDGMDGHDVAKAIRADPELRPAYLVAMTGYG